MFGRSPRLATALNGPVALLVLVGLVAGWSLPIATRMIDAGDYPDHLRIAAAVADVPHLPAPHFLYFVSVAAAMIVVPGLPVRVAGLAVTTGFLILTALVVWWYLRRTGANASPVLTVLLTVVLLMVGPVLPPMVNPDVYLIGYFVPNPYHNATIVAARPFAVALVVCAAAAIGRGQIRISPWLAAAVVLLSAVAKPNYLLCLVPALAIAAAAHLVLCRPIRWSVLLAIVIPAVTIVWAFHEAYGARGVNVIVAPFAALRFHTAVDATLAMKLVASVAFPLTVVMLWPRLLATHGQLALAWGAVGVAALQGYLLAEAGPRMDHANLLAGASIAVFVLMVTSCSAILGGSRPRATHERARLTIAWTVFALHVWGGFRHLLVTMMTPERWVTPLGLAAVAIAAVWIAIVRGSSATNGVAAAGKAALPGK